MQQQDILLSHVNQQLKQVFLYVSMFSTKNVTGYYRREIYVKFLI